MITAQTDGIVPYTDPTTNIEIWRLPTQKSGIYLPYYQLWKGFSPDGKYISFIGGNDMNIIHADGSNHTAFGERNGTPLCERKSGDWAKDGRSIYTSSALRQILMGVMRGYDAEGSLVLIEDPDAAPNDWILHDLFPNATEDVGDGTGPIIRTCQNQDGTSEDGSSLYINSQADTLLPFGGASLSPDGRFLIGSTMFSNNHADEISRLKIVNLETGQWQTTLIPYKGDLYEKRGNFLFRIGKGENQHLDNKLFWFGNDNIVYNSKDALTADDGSNLGTFSRYLLQGIHSDMDASESSAFFKTEAEQSKLELGLHFKSYFDDCDRCSLDVAGIEDAGEEDAVVCIDRWNKRWGHFGHVNIDANAAAFGYDENNNLGMISGHSSPMDLANSNVTTQECELRQYRRFSGGGGTPITNTSCNWIEPDEGETIMQAKHSVVGFHSAFSPDSKVVLTNGDRFDSGMIYAYSTKPQGPNKYICNNDQSVHDDNIFQPIARFAPCQIYGKYPVRDDLEVDYTEAFSQNLQNSPMANWSPDGTKILFGSPCFDVWEDNSITMDEHCNCVIVDNVTSEAPRLLLNKKCNAFSYDDHGPDPEANTAIQQIENPTEVACINAEHKEVLELTNGKIPDLCSYKFDITDYCLLPDGTIDPTCEFRYDEKKNSGSGDLFVAVFKKPQAPEALALSTAEEGELSVSWQAGTHRETKEFVLSHAADSESEFRVAAVFSDEKTFLHTPVNHAGNLPDDDLEMTVDSTLHLDRFNGRLEIAGRSTAEASEIADYEVAVGGRILGMNRLNPQLHYNDAFVWQDNSRNPERLDFNLNGNFAIQAKEWSGLKSELLPVDANDQAALPFTHFQGPAFDLSTGSIISQLTPRAGTETLSGPPVYLLSGPQNFWQADETLLREDLEVSNKAQLRISDDILIQDLTLFDGTVVFTADTWRDLTGNLSIVGAGNVISNPGNGMLTINSFVKGDGAAELSVLHGRVALGNTANQYSGRIVVDESAQLRLLSSTRLKDAVLDIRIGSAVIYHQDVISKNTRIDMTSASTLYIPEGVTISLYDWSVDGVLQAAGDYSSADHPGLTGAGVLRLLQRKSWGDTLSKDPVSLQRECLTGTWGPDSEPWVAKPPKSQVEGYQALCGSLIATDTTFPNDLSLMPSANLQVNSDSAHINQLVLRGGKVFADDTLPGFKVLAGSIRVWGDRSRIQGAIDITADLIAEKTAELNLKGHVTLSGDNTRFKGALVVKENQLITSGTSALGPDTDVAVMQGGSFSPLSDHQFHGLIMEDGANLTGAGHLVVHYLFIQDCLQPAGTYTNADFPALGDITVEVSPVLNLSWSAETQCWNGPISAPGQKRYQLARGSFNLNDAGLQTEQLFLQEDGRLIPNVTRTELAGLHLEGGALLSAFDNWREIKAPIYVNDPQSFLSNQGQDSGSNSNDRLIHKNLAIGGNDKVLRVLSESPNSLVEYRPNDAQANMTSGNHLFSGTHLIERGRLKVYQPNALGESNAVVLNDGTLHITAAEALWSGSRLTLQGNHSTLEIGNGAQLVVNELIINEQRIPSGISFPLTQMTEEEAAPYINAAKQIKGNGNITVVDSL